MSKIQRVSRARLIVGTLIVACAFSISHAPIVAANPSAQQLSDLAQTKFNAEDYKTAIELISQAISLDPESPSNGVRLIFRAKTKRALKDFKGALQDLTEAERLAPKSLPQVLRERGLTKYRMEDYSGAESDLRRSLETDPDWYAYCKLGNACYELGKNEDAKNAEEKSIKMNPNYVDSYRLLGYALEKLGDTAGAERAYKKAIAIPEAQIAKDGSGLFYFCAVMSYAELLRRQGRFEDAKPLFARAKALPQYSGNKKLVDDKCALNDQSIGGKEASGK